MHIIAFNGTISRPVSDLLHGQNKTKTVADSKFFFCLLNKSLGITRCAAPFITALQNGRMTTKAHGKNNKLSTNRMRKTHTNRERLEKSREYCI